MSGVSLDQAPATMSGYACPFCSIEISEKRQTTSPALLAFEAHLDFHMARGDEPRAAAPPAPRLLRPSAAA